MRGRPLGKQLELGGLPRGEGATSGMPCGASGLLLGRLAGRGGLLRGQIRASRRRSRTHILPISIHEEPIIEKKRRRGWSPRRSHLSALWFRCLGVPREAMNFSSSLVRMRDRARLSYPACETRDGRSASFRLILGQGAEVAERSKFPKGRESEETCAPPDRRLKSERVVW